MITEEIRKIIEKNLSAEVGSTLQELLKKGEDAIRNEVVLRDSLSVKSQVIRQHEATIKRLQDSLGKHEDLDIKVANLQERERNYKIGILEIRLEESEKRADMVRDFTSGLVRNTLYRKTMFDSENQMGYTDSNGVWHQPMLIEKNLNETKSEE